MHIILLFDVTISGKDITFTGQGVTCPLQHEWASIVRVSQLLPGLFLHQSPIHKWMTWAVCWVLWDCKLWGKHCKRKWQDTNSQCCVALLYCFLKRKLYFSLTYATYNPALKESRERALFCRRLCCFRIWFLSVGNNTLFRKKKAWNCGLSEQEVDCPRAMSHGSPHAAGCPTAVATENSSYQGRMSLEALRATAPSTSQISAKEPGQQAVRKLGRVLIETPDFDKSANAQLKTCQIFSNQLYSQFKQIKGVGRKHYTVLILH